MCCHPELLHHLVAGHVQDLHNDAARHRRAEPAAVRRRHHHLRRRTGWLLVDLGLLLATGRRPAGTP